MDDKIEVEKVIKAEQETNLQEIQGDADEIKNENPNINKQVQLELVNNYYSHASALETIVPYLRDKEVVFYNYYVSGIRLFRGLKVNTINDFRALGKRYDFFSKLSNLYYSLSILDMPVLSVINEVKKSQIQQFNQDFKKLMKGMDFGMDFDAKGEFTLEDAKKDAGKVCELLNEFKIKYFLKCSGSGLHIDIPFNPKIMRDSITNFDTLCGVEKDGRVLNGFYDDFCGLLCDMLLLKCVDRTIYDYRRIWKCPFSLDVKSGNVALPIKPEEIKDFTYDKVYCENVKDETILYWKNYLAERNKAFDAIPEAEREDMQSIWEYYIQEKWKPYIEPEEGLVVL